MIRRAWPAMSDFRQLIVVDEGPLSALAMAKEIQAHPMLRAHESKFVDDMILLTAGRREPSPKQARWLAAIYARLRV